MPLTLCEESCKAHYASSENSQQTAEKNSRCSRCRSEQSLEGSHHSLSSALAGVIKRQGYSGAIGLSYKQNTSVSLCDFRALFAQSAHGVLLQSVVNGEAAARVGVGGGCVGVGGGGGVGVTGVGGALVECWRWEWMPRTALESPVFATNNRLPTIA